MNKAGSKKKKSFRNLKKLIINRSIIIFMFFSFISLLCFGVYQILKSFFAVKYIYAESTTIYDREALINASKIEKDTILFFVNSKEAETNICNSLSYINSAKIIKRLPNTIKIEVSLAKPEFNLVDDENYLLISKNNKLLEKKEFAMPEIPSILGLKFFISENNRIVYENSKLKESIDIIFETFKNNGLFSLVEIDASNESHLKLNYDNKIKIVFGSTEDIEYKVLTAKEIIINKIKSNENGTLDLSKLGENNKSYFTLNIK